MQKIQLAVDAVNPNPHSLDFACYLGNLTNSIVTGVFLENLVADQAFVLTEMQGHKYAEWVVDKDTPAYQKKMKTIEKNIELFKNSCESRAVRYSVRRDTGDPTDEVIRESRYADIVVIDAEASFNNKNEEIPTEFAKKVLKDSECPVIIAPESFEGIDEIVFTWDGSKSAMFAIKQFCYLFPELDDKKVKVLSVSNEDSAIEREEFKELKQWIGSHYSSIGFEVLKGDPEVELFASLFRKKNQFIVTGAYGRSGFSQFFKRSSADLLIKTSTQAIFVAHH